MHDLVLFGRGRLGFETDLPTLSAECGFAFEPKGVWELAHKRLGEKSSA